MVPKSLSLRHFVPMFFILGLIGSCILSLVSTQAIVLLGLVFGSYLSAAVLFSIRIGLKEGVKHIFLLPIVFFSLHLTYGLGMLAGILTSWRFTRER